MNARLRSLSLLAVLTLALPALAAPDESVTKPVKTVVQSVRYGKDDLALKNFASEEQGRQLLGESWGQGTEAQRKEFIQLFNSLFSQLAFPKVRENFKNLASITYEDPEVTGTKAKLRSIILIDHPVKKQEMKLQYTLAKEGAEWKVVDVTVLGDSMLTGIREDQIQPIMKEGGWEMLLELMRQKNAELDKAKKEKEKK
jgi:phospholipid transport system substrate-binding protein